MGLSKKSYRRYLDNAAIEKKKKNPKKEPNVDDIIRRKRIFNNGRGQANEMIVVWCIISKIPKEGISIRELAVIVNMPEWKVSYYLQRLRKLGVAKKEWVKNHIGVKTRWTLI